MSDEGKRRANAWLLRQASGDSSTLSLLVRYVWKRHQLRAHIRRHGEHPR